VAKRGNPKKKVSPGPHDGGGGHSRITRAQRNPLPSGKNWSGDWARKGKILVPNRKEYRKRVREKYPIQTLKQPWKEKNRWGKDFCKRGGVDHITTESEHREEKG